MGRLKALVIDAQEYGISLSQFDLSKVKQGKK